MTADYDVGYLVEQLVEALLVFIAMVFFIGQLLSELYAPRQVITVKKLFHRLGLVAVILCAVRVIDPLGMHGIYPAALVNFLSVNTTLVLFWCVLGATYYVINANYGIVLAGKPHKIKHFFMVLGAFAAVVVNTVYTVMTVEDREWIRGVGYVFYSAVYFSIALVGFISIRRLRAAIKRVMSETMFLTHTMDGSPGRSKDDTLVRSMSRLLQLQIFGGVMVLAACSLLLYRGIAKLSEDMSAPVEVVDTNTYSVYPNLFTWFQWLTIALVGWWAHIPMYFCCAPTRRDDKAESLIGSRHFRVASTNTQSAENTYSAEYRPADPVMDIPRLSDPQLLAGADGGAANGAAAVRRDSYVPPRPVTNLPQSESGQIIFIEDDSRIL